MNWRKIKSGLAQAFAYDDGRAEISAADLAMLDKVAEWVVRRGLCTPAMLILEGSAPLNFVGSSLLTFFRPVVGLGFNTTQWERFEALLEKRCALRLLSERIEACEAAAAAARQKPRQPSRPAAKSARRKG